MTQVNAPVRGRVDSELGSAEAIRLIAAREIRVRLQSKAYVWTTVAMVAAILVGAVLIRVFGDDQGTLRVGLTGEAASIAGPLEATADAFDTTVETQPVSDEAAGVELVQSGDLDALVTATAPQLAITVKEQLDAETAPLVGALAQQLALAAEVTDLGGDPATVSQALAAAAPVVTSLEPAPEVDGGQIVAGFIAGILLFLALQTSGQYVAVGVVEEKTSRVVELLLATIRPWQLMTGKVVGIGALGLAQVVLVIAAGAGSALALGLLETSSLNLGSAAGWAIVWFVIGFAMYAFVLAALGALVSRQEDVGGVVAPVIMLMVVPYVVGVSIAPWDPDNPLVVWLSYVPFCSPLLMPMRIALDSAAPWEIALTVGLSLATIPGLMWLSGRMYQRAVLHARGRMSFREAIGVGED